MEFQRINRTNAEQAFGICENRNGATILGNQPVAFTTTAGSNAGYEVVAPASANIFTMAGITDADIADAAVGRYQCYGFRDSVKVYAHGTSATISAGVVMGPHTASDGVGANGEADTFGPTVAMELIGALVTSPGGYGKAFIRLL
jgi:hypothetical protein